MGQTGETNFFAEENIPAFMTARDFAIACGISRKAADEWISIDPDRYRVIDGTRMVPLHVFCERIGTTEDELRSLFKKVTG